VDEGNGVGQDKFKASDLVVKNLTILFLYVFCIRGMSGETFETMLS